MERAALFELGCSVVHEVAVSIKNQWSNLTLIRRSGALLLSPYYRECFLIVVRGIQGPPDCLIQFV